MITIRPEQLAALAAASIEERKRALAAYLAGAWPELTAVLPGVALRAIVEDAVATERIHGRAGTLADLLAELRLVVGGDLDQHPGLGWVRDILDERADASTKRERLLRQLRLRRADGGRFGQYHGTRTATELDA